MRIHNLNCGSFCPRGARLVNGEGGLSASAEVCCHCLLVEAGERLVLVDTGLGLEDARNPRQLGALFGALMRPRPTIASAAITQVEALGFAPTDVTDVVVTHLDLDHAGGLPDFPHAEVHLLAAELEAATKPALSDRSRYIGGAHWRHGPRWVTYGAGGDDWFGFESLRLLPGLDAEMTLIPLVGHSRGHTGVAVRAGEGWVLHCGDAFFHHGELASPPSCPPLLRLFQTLTASDNAARRRNQERLRELAAVHGDEVTLISGHDPRQLELARARAGDAAEADAGAAAAP